MQPQRPDAAAPRVPAIDVRAAWERISAVGHPVALIDVRETWEFEGGHAKHAISIPLSELRQRVAEVPRDRDVLLICHSGQRSFTAARFLQQQGIAQVVNVTGGTEQWEHAGLPMVWRAR